MKTQTKILTTAAFAAALLAGTASASGISPIGQFSSTSVALRTDTGNMPAGTYGYTAGAQTVAVQPVVVQAHKAQAPSSYELHSILVRAPVNPEVVRAQGE